MNQKLKLWLLGLAGAGIVGAVILFMPKNKKHDKTASLKKARAAKRRKAEQAAIDKEIEEILDTHEEADTTDTNEK